MLEFGLVRLVAFIYNLYSYRSSAGRGFRRALGAGVSAPVRGSGRVKAVKQVTVFKRLGFLLTAVGVLGFAGCRWDSELHDLFVDEQTGRAELCEGLEHVRARDGITECRAGDASATGPEACRSIPGLALAFVHGLCPKGYACIDVEREIEDSDPDDDSEQGEEGAIIRFCAIKAGTCKPNVCRWQGVECRNDDRHCGSDCKNCTAQGGVLEGVCNTDKGECEIRSCVIGYHPDNVDAPTRCMMDSVTACGSVSNNCTGQPGWKEGGCFSGRCEASSCQPGYHLAARQCHVDSLTACGSPNNNCAGLPGWGSGSCVNGACVAQSCKVTDNEEDGYCLQAGVCRNGRFDLMACGIAGGQVACEDCSKEELSCVKGECTISVCRDGNICSSWSGQCLNADEHCGVNCQNCNLVDNAKEGRCNDAGVCEIISCRSGFHLVTASFGSVSNPDVTTSCAEDNVENCGSVRYSCSDEVDGWLDGVCASGNCVALACKPGYRRVDEGLDSTCAIDVEACGSQRFNCTLFRGWGSGTCEEGKCVVEACTGGYELIGNACQIKCSGRNNHCRANERCGSDNNCRCGANYGASGCSGSNKCCTRTRTNWNGQLEVEYACQSNSGNGYVCP